MRLRVAAVFVLLSFSAFAQRAQISTSKPSVNVPHLIRISGQMRPANSTVGVTFALYKSQTDSAPLWTEAQNIALDAAGRYTTLIGATKVEGIPLELFASGKAQWLGIRREGQAEQPRVLLVSVPYAMKAVEAETLSGHKAEEFVTQKNLGEMVQLKLQEPEIRTVLGNPFVGGTTAVTDGATNFTDSTNNQIILVTQNGTGKLIVGEGPSHTPVFSVDQVGIVHGSGLTLDASASRAVSMGNNPVSGGAGHGLVVQAGAPASGTANKRGGELVLAAGTGTGTGGSGDVVIRTGAPGASGTAGNTLVSRHVYASSPVSMGGAVGGVTLAALTPAPSSSGAIAVRFKIHATNGSNNYGVATGECIVAGSLNSDASESFLTVILGSDYTEAASWGSFGTSCTVGNTPNGTWSVNIGDNLPFTPAEHSITYEISNISEWPVVLYANTSGAEKMPLKTASTTPPATREHPRVIAKRDASGNWVEVGDLKKP